MYLIHSSNKYSYFVILASSHFWEKQILINTVYILSIPLPSSILLPFSPKLITMSCDVYYIYYIGMQYKTVPYIQVYIQSKCSIKIQTGGTSLVVHWLRLRALTMQRTKILHVTRFGQKKKEKNTDWKNTKLVYHVGIHVTHISRVLSTIFIKLLLNWDISEHKFQS